jgi:hypothetical protein
VQFRQAAPTPIAMRSPKQLLKDGGGTPVTNKATKSVPFSTRFALLVFSIRLKFTESAAGLEALKVEAKSLKQSARTANLSSVVETIATMQATIERKLNPHLAIPLAGGPGFRF